MVCALALPMAFAQKPVSPKTDKMATGKMSTGKKTPARDPKTGRFVKKTEPAKGMSGKMSTGKMSTGKKTPARDPKTGRFMKSGKTKGKTDKPKM